MSTPFFKIEMLPAKHGDALLVEYGDEARTRRMLIDGGPRSAFPAIEKRLRQIPTGETGIELLVVTHVDTDHIDGIIRLLDMRKADWLIDPSEIWFNGWNHLDETHLGGREGDLLGALIHTKAGDKWNKSFSGSSVRADTDKASVELAGGMKLTLLSPTRKELLDLRKDWQSSSRKWKLVPGSVEQAMQQLDEMADREPETPRHLGPEDLTEELKALLGVDGSRANGSSIAFLAEFEGMRCMFLGDAFMSVVCDSLRKLGASKETPLRVDAVKVSHHGSANNLTPEFLELVDAEHYLISTDGSKHGHPDEAAIQTILVGSQRPSIVWFNHRCKTTEHWEARAGADRTRYPEPGREGVVVTLTR